MKKYSVILLMMVAGLAQAQISTDSTTSVDSKKTFRHHIGVTYGAVGGDGLAYRYRTNRWGAHATIGLSGKNTNSKWLYACNLLYTLKQTEKSNLYLYTGFSSYKDRKNAFDATTERTTYITGLGLGVEFIVSNRFTFNFQSAINRSSLSHLTEFSSDLGVYYRF